MERARRGLPLEPEGESLIGRRDAIPRQPAAGSSPAAGVLVGAPLVWGVFACVFIGLSLGFV